MTQELIKTDWQRGDPIPATQMTNLSRVASRVSNIPAGSYATGANYGTFVGHTNQPPWVQGIYIVTAVNGDKTYQIRRRRYDHTNGAWVTETQGGPELLDASGLANVEFEVDDKLPAFWDAQRGAYIPLCCETELTSTPQ